jgi:hypothetical protein
MRLSRRLMYVRVHRTGAEARLPDVRYSMGKLLAGKEEDGA